VSGFACVGLGAAPAVLGLLPWLVTGMRLPLQDLWAAPTLPGDVPVALLPLSQCSTSLVPSLLVVGYGVAGVVVRTVRTRLPRGAVLAAAAGALAVDVVAGVQALTTVAAGLSERTASDVHLAALVAVVVAGVVAGLVVLRLVTASARAAAAVGSTLVALVTGTWVGELLAPLAAVAGPSSALVAERWVPALLVGAAIAWGGLGTVGRTAASVLGLLLLWLVPAAATAVTSAAGSRVLLRYPSEMAASAVAVLRAALLDPALVLPPLLLALVVAVAGTALQRLLRRRVVVRGA